MKNQDFEIRFKTGTRIEQIEKASIVLYNLFGALQSNAISPDDDAKFQDETFSFCQIGTALVDSIYENISYFIEPEPDEREDETEHQETEDIAISLSEILNNPKLPITLYNSLQNAIAEVYNKGDNESLNRLESSPEYLRAVIEASEAQSNG